MKSFTLFSVALSKSNVEDDEQKCKTHHQICEHLLQFQQCSLVFDILSILHRHTHTVRIYNVLKVNNAVLVCSALGLSRRL